ncbi:O-acetyltransferase CAS1 like protein [Verticillium longisporum]|uniref:O-acetyltransferase CAS1 like protein n=1 Tax=Verticillium longisporum TaxID=100787 RepID=A0A8I3ALV0_VERLO|nr:O-acetyltransferase CAS1 like protein [Verticillium longisporum]
MASNSSWPRVATVLFPAIFLVTIFLNSIFSVDPYRCGALIGDGQWIDPVDANGTRRPFNTWQPDGCMMRKYTSDDIHRCMEGRHMVFSGDSTTRQVFWGMARLLDRDLANKTRRESATRAAYDMEFGGIRMRQIWNPFMDLDKDGVELKKELELYRHERENPVPLSEQKAAALTMIGFGSWWALRYFEEESLKQFSSAIDNVTAILRQQDYPKFGQRPMIPGDGIGNEVFIAPIAPPYYDDLPSKRKGPKGLHVGEVESMDEYLDSVRDERSLNLLWAFPALSRTEPVAMVDRHETGFHVIDSVAETKATILLNARCNAKLDAMDGYPHNRTCCTNYGGPSLVQLMFLFFGTCYVIACVVYETYGILKARVGRRAPFDMETGLFVTALLACYHADRTQFLAKASKMFVYDEFTVMTAICVLVFLFTIRRSRAASQPDTIAPQKTPEANILLPRDQTEEWKGWMQAAILVYHWIGASKDLGIYIFIRLLVASYLFQTGYGHTVFFLKKKDFGFKRIAATMLRLNLLTCALPYVMGTDYMFYYFAPLVSFWFMVVYSTLAIGRQHNDNLGALLGKISISAFITYVVMMKSPVPEWSFTVLRLLCNIKWDLHEWTFRVGLDAFIVFVGMLTAIAHVRYPNACAWALGSYVGAVVGLVAMYGYYHACGEYFPTKEIYNSWHPYISWIPILSFIAVRNMPGPAQLFTSSAAAWLGRCSLETFTLQFHLFLAADTKGVLRLGMFSGDSTLFNDRWRDLVFIVPIFLWVSSRLAEATGALVKLVTDGTVGQKAENESEKLWSVNSKFDELILARVRPLMPAMHTWANDLRVRVAMMFGVMWVLNLLS